MSLQTLLVGLGAPKAGTTWLAAYLNDHPECASFGPKELHFFNARRNDRLQWQIDQQQGKLDRMTARLSKAALKKGRRKQLERQVEAYGRWIEALKAGSDEDWLAYLEWCGRDAKVAFDITPPYGMLPAETYKRMMELHPDVRFVFLVREPVSRLWSNARMWAGRRAREAGDEADDAALEASAREIMRGAVDGSETGLMARADYASVLGKLRAIGPERAHVGFYEELFTDEGVGAICDHLGIERRPGDYARRVWSNERKATLDDETRARARAALAPQYEAVEAWFGRLPAAWTGGGKTEAA
jgi:hypothetical protein